MRSIEYLVQLYPNKTGKEILEIQANDKLDDQRKFEKHNKKRLEFIKEINENGGYYKGRFGIDQRFYYNVTNARLEADRLIGDVENITAFFGEKKSVLSEGEIRIERTFKSYEDLSTYGLEIYERTTKEDYEKALNYVQGLKNFWV